MRRVAIAIGLWLALCVGAQAQTSETINQWGSASTLTGTELVPLCQGCSSSTAAVSVLLSTIKTFINAGAVTPSGTLTAGDVVCGAGTSVVQDCSATNANVGTTLKVNPASALSLNNVAAQASLGLWLNESFTGTCGGQCGGNLLNITSDNAAVGTGVLGTGFQFTHAFGGGAMTGNRGTVTINSQLANTSGNAAGVFPSYAAIATQMVANANDNGTGLTVTTANGQVQGGNFIGSLGASATDFWALQGAEIDVHALTGSTVYRKMALGLGGLSDDKVQGTVDDAMILLGNENGAVGFRNGIQFGFDAAQTSGAFPVVSTGTLFSCGGNCSGTTVANVMDYSALTVSGNSIKMPNGFFVTGAGQVGIGGSPGAPLEVQATTTATSGTNLGIEGLFTLSPASTSSQNYTGVSGQLTLTTAQNDTGTFVGTRGFIVNQNTGTLNSAEGLASAITLNGAGTITTAHSVDATITNRNGTINNAVALFVEQPNGPNSATTSTWINSAGVEIQDQNPTNSGGTVSLTNPPAAIKIDSQTASNALAINQVGSGISQFAGTVNITGVLETAEVLGTVTSQAGTTYTLAATDCGTQIRFTSASPVTVTIPATLVTSCNIAITQIGAGKVSVNGSAVSPATLHSAHSYTGTFGQFAIIGINIDQTGDAILTGDGS